MGNYLIFWMLHRRGRSGHQATLILLVSWEMGLATMPYRVYIAGLKNIMFDEAPAITSMPPGAAFLFRRKTVMSFRFSGIARAMLVPAFIVILGGVSAAPVLAAPPPTIVAKSLTAVAIVETTDPATRQVLLSGPGGKLLTVTAGPEIRNFAQIQPGDRLVLTLRKAVAVQVAPRGSALPPPSGVAGAARAARGELPAGAGFMAVEVQVRVDAIDRANHTVTFTDPDGVSHTAELHNPAMIRFVNKLRVGDNVQIEYLQSVSITLHPMPG
jgi:hypothetical protein